MLERRCCPWFILIGESFELMTMVSTSPSRSQLLFLFDLGKWRGGQGARPKTEIIGSANKRYQNPNNVVF